MHLRAVTIACVLVAATASAHAEPGFEEALHAQMRANQGNLFYSPASVRLALAMAMFGARGATQSELAKALQLAPSPQIARAIGAQLEQWEQLARPDSQQPTLRVRNRVWAQSGRALVDDYVTTLRDLLHAPLGTADFAHDPAGARRTINDWIADATEQKIPSLIGSELDEQTRLVLTNAVYFKARWASPFLATRTTDERFFADGSKPVTVRMMHDSGWAGVARIDGGLMLERRYGGGGQLVMDILLPDARNGLHAVEDAYVRGELSSWVRDLKARKVDLSLPKVQIATAMWLTPALRGLGVVHATRRADADFSGIDGTRELYITQVIHEAAVDVDESGTEAVAATAVMVGAPTMAMPAPEEVIVVRVDHPFLFLIRDASANVVLFAGRVVDPTVK